jgi:GDP-L-fucose synthase
MDLKQKSVLITGGAGFLGKHVVSSFCKEGCKNVITPRRKEFDLTETTSARRLLAQSRPDLVVHLAAICGGIGANLRFPGTFFYQNLAMGIHLIEECRKARIEKTIIIGTVCSYPKFTPTPFRESDLWNGYPEETNAPYGLAKKMLGVQLQAYRQEFGFFGVQLLLVNLFGPGDNFDLNTSHVIPALIRKCVEARERGNEEIHVWGSGRPTREFLYVEDAAGPVILATQHGNSPEPINIGSGEEISIADLARLIASKVGFRGRIRFDLRHPDGQPRRCLDVSQAKEILGFTAATSLSEGLDRTIDWYLSSRECLRVAA